MQLLKGLGAYDYDTDEKCLKVTGKPPVPTTWVDVGSAVQVVRCRSAAPHQPRLVGSVSDVFSNADIRGVTVLGLDGHDAHGDQGQ